MNFIILSIICSCIILDKYAFGEFGISQPLITGTIIGALFHDIEMGIFLGAMLQLVFLTGLPIGRDIPPDGQVAGMVGTGSYFLLRIGNQPGHALLLSVLFAFLAALIGGTLDIVARHYNDRLYRYFAQGKYRLSTVHLFGLVTAFIRGLCIFLPFFLIARIITAPSYFPYMSRTFFMIVSIGVGIANALYLFRKQSTLVYICLGGLCGLALLVF